jgi:hypothetical protein
VNTAPNPDTAAGAARHRRVEEVTGERVRRRAPVRNTVPVDLAPAGAEGADLILILGAEIGPEPIDGRLDRGGVRAGSLANFLGLSGRWKRQESGESRQGYESSRQVGAG